MTSVEVSCGAIVFTRQGGQRRYLIVQSLEGWCGFPKGHTEPGETEEETAREDSDPEQAALAFICKRLKLNYKKLSEEEKKWLKKIAQKSDLLKNPNPQRGRK